MENVRKKWNVNNILPQSKVLCFRHVITIKYSKNVTLLVYCISRGVNRAGRGKGGNERNHPTGPPRFNGSGAEWGGLHWCFKIQRMKKFKLKIIYKQTNL